MRVFVSLTIACLIGLFVLTIAAGLTGSLAVAAIFAVLVAPLVGLVAWRRSVAFVDFAASSRALTTASCVAVVVTVVMLSRLTVFIVDPSRPSY